VAEITVQNSNRCIFIVRAPSLQSAEALRHAAYEDDFYNDIGQDRVDALRVLLGPLMSGAGKDDLAF
jgi:hypothetical protein